MKLNPDAHSILDAGLGYLKLDVTEAESLHEMIDVFSVMVSPSVFFAAFG